MQCSCGEETRLQTHTVKTLDKAQEWLRDFPVKESDLPISVEQDKCPACGRQITTIKAKWNDILARRG